MGKGTGSGKARSRTRLFGDITKHKGIIEYHKGKCISVFRYETKGSNVDRYVGTVEFEHSYADMINSVISQLIMPYGAKYDVYLKTANDRRYVLACVSMNCDDKDIGTKNCFNLCRKLVDLIMRQIERESRHDGEDDDLEIVISDRIDEIKILISTLINFEIGHIGHAYDDKNKCEKIKKTAISDILAHVEKLKEKL